MMYHGIYSSFDSLQERIKAPKAGDYAIVAQRVDGELRHTTYIYGKDWTIPEERYRFNEPHPWGFDSTVEATRGQIITFMRQYEEQYGFSIRLRRAMTDDECIEEFCTVHGAWKLEIGDLDSCKERIKHLAIEIEHYKGQCMSKAISEKMARDYYKTALHENRLLREELEKAKAGLEMIARGQQKAPGSQCEVPMNAPQMIRIAMETLEKVGP